MMGTPQQTGSVDTYGSVDLYKQLVAVGVPSELHLLNGYGHQFDTSSGAYASVDAIPTVADLTVRFFIKQWERKLAGGHRDICASVYKSGGIESDSDCTCDKSQRPRDDLSVDQKWGESCRKNRCDSCFKSTFGDRQRELCGGSGESGPIVVAL